MSKYLPSKSLFNITHQRNPIKGSYNISGIFINTLGGNKLKIEAKTVSFIIGGKKLKQKPFRSSLGEKGNCSLQD